MKSAFFLLLFYCFGTYAGYSQCQDITNSNMSVVCINTTVTYTYTGSSTKFSWSLSGGGTHPPTGIGVRDFVVTWTGVGSHSVTFTDLDDPNGYCNIPVTVETAEGGTATANTPTVCQGSSATVSLSGHNGNVIKWQKSVNNGSWQDISHTSTSLTDNNVQYTTRYKAFVSECGSTVTSSIATVNIEIPNGGTISKVSGNSSFCSGESAAGTLRLNNYEGIIKRWEKRVRQSNGTWGSWTSAGSGSETLNYGVSAETSFRAITDDGICLQVPSSNTYTITETSPAVAGTISASKAGPVCIGETFSLSITGQDGTVNWYEKEEFHDWVPLSSTSNISITRDTEYKAVVSKPLCNNEKTTNIISMSIKDPPVPGSVGTSHTVCQGGSGTVSLSGHVGTVVRWEKNEYDKITSQWSGWVLAVENSSTSYSYSNLQKTTKYRAIVKNDCNETLPSMSATVTVESRPSTGDLTLTSGLAVFCGGSNTVTLSLSNYTGSFERWEKREQVNGVWGQWEPANDHIMPSEQETFTVTNTTAFRVVVKGIYCGEELGDALTIVKEQASEAGYISISTGTPEVCRNEAFSLTLNDYVGNSIEWYKKSGVHDWESLSSVENISITEDALFKAVVQNASCAADETQELAVTIKPDPVVGTFSLNTQEACEGEAVALSVTSFSGANLKWQYSTDSGATWVTEAEGTATSVTIPVYTSAMWRAQVVGVCDNTIVSNTLQLTVRSLPVTPVVSSRTVCPGTELELSVDNPQVQPTIYAWYNGSQQLLEKTAVNKLPIGPIEASATYYVAFENNACLSQLVPVQVNTLDAAGVPSRPYTEVITGPTYSVSLHKNNTDDKFTSYYFQTSKEGMEEDISPNEVNNPEPGFYFVRGKSSNGCWGPASEGIEVINHQPTAYSYNTPNVNFVRTYNFLQPSVSVSYGSDLDLESDPEKLQTATQYIDGLGRPVQEVVKMGSPSGNDLVTPVEYDETGNIKRQYLPYVSINQDGSLNVNPIVDQRNYYQSTPDVASSYFPFSYTQPERSSLGRSEANFAPGADWAATAGTSQERGIQTNYLSNNTAESVYHWDVNGTGEPVVTEVCQANNLFVTETVDEEGHATREYTNRRGQTILKRVQADESAATWAETYYVYDSYGNLRYVLQPEAVRQIGNLTTFPYAPGATLLARWAFQYKYDHRNRLIEKRVPGADWVYMVYDNRDRLVLTQDGNQRIKGEWLFTKYDALNRSILTGIYNHSGDRATVQNEVNDFYEYNIQWDQMAGVSYEDGIFTKTAAYNWGNGGASSFTLIQAGEDGKVSVEATETNLSRMFGLSDTSPDHHYNTIDFAINMQPSGYLSIYESGVKMISFSVNTRYFTGDVLTVERVGNTIYYKKNDQVLYTSTKSSATSLVVDMAFSHQGSTLKFLQPSWYEEKGGSWGNVLDYSNLSFPYISDERQFLTASWYDDYDFHHAALPDFAFIPDEDHSTYFNRVKGLVTGTKTRILGDDRWISTVNYYDDKYRVIQTVSNNHKEGTERMTSTYDFVGKVLESKLTHFQPMKVTWKNLVGAQATGNCLTSTSAGSWSSGASSANTLAENEDGWLQTMVSETSHNKFIGFNEFDDSHSHYEIDYAVYVYEGSLRAYRNGVHQSTIGAIKPGDYIRMERVNGEVRVLLNNELRYTFADLSTTKLLIDVSFYTAPATFSYVTCSFGIPETKAPYPILWTGMNANALTRADSLTKTGPSGWNAGASSINKLLPGESGWLEFTTKQNNTNFLVGLSDRDEGIDLATIDYAIYFRYEGVFRVYENGNHLGEYGTYAAGDVFKIERTGQTISYLKNGQVFKTSDVPSVSGLIADVTLHGEGTTITNVKASFGYTSPTETQTDITRSYDYDHAGRLLKTYHEVTETIQWVQRNNTTVNGNTIEKTSGTDYVWDAGAESSNILPAGRDGWIEMTTDRNNRSLFFGLSEYSADDNWNTIENAFYLTGGGQVQIRRAPSGTNFLGYARSYAAGDIFRIERKDTDLHFYHNGELIHTRSGVANTNLKVDISFYQIGSRITDAKMGFGKVLLAENKYNELGELIEKDLHVENNVPHQSIDYRYNIRGWLKSINNADLSDGERDLFGMELAYNENWTEIGNAPAFNGNISAVKWKSTGMGLGRSYGFIYDPMDRLESATYATGSGSAWANPTNAFNTTYDYELNGNITHLTRNHIQPDMDVLDYVYEGNKLLSVTDFGDISTGFTDGNPDGNDYAYDPNGNATQDLNKGVTNITYNYLNLQDTVRKDGGGYIRYIYDAKGVKLGQETYDADGNLQSRSDYIGEFVYEDDTLKQIQHEEGTIVANETGGGFEYRYDIKDHLGNTRLTFTTRPKTLDFAAGFESGNAIDEESIYYNIAETRVTFNSADANNDGGTEVTRVNGTQPMGAGVALFVAPGDTLEMEVYGYYEGGSGYSTQSGLNTMIAAIAGGFGGATGSGATEAQQATYDAFDNALSGIGLMGTSNDNVPAAFLNYILFDENMVMYQNGFVQIGTAANGSHERIALEDILVNKEGLAYVWVSNESVSTNWVYFDDMNVTIHEGAVIQEEDYYPLGLTFNGYKRYEPDYDGTYNSGGLGLKDLGFRQYDPSIGRFHVIDPLAELQLDYSPYQYAGNNPINNVDLLGLLSDAEKNAKKRQKEARRKARQKQRQAKRNKGLKLKGQNDNSSARGSRRSGSKDDRGSTGSSGSTASAKSSKESRSVKQSESTASNSENKKENESDPFESFRSREGAFEPLLKGNNTIAGADRLPRYNPSQVARREIEQPQTGSNPTVLAKWHREASNAENMEKLRQDLYSNLPYNEARAVESLTVLGRNNDPAAASLKRRIAVLANEKGFKDDGGSNPQAVQEVLDAIKDANANGDATVDLRALKKKYRSTTHRNSKVKINGKDLDISIVFGFGDLILNPDQNNPDAKNGRVTYDFDQNDGQLGIKIYINSGSAGDLESYLGISEEPEIDQLLADILPSDISEADKDKYETVLKNAKNNGGVSTNITQDDWVTDQTKDEVSVLDENKKQKKAADGTPLTTEVKRECWTATQMIMQNAGYTSGKSTEVYQMALEHKSNSELIHDKENTNKGLRNIMDHFNDKRPVQVGTHYGFKKGYNWDKSTDHFVILTKMKFDSERNEFYFEYYEVGTEHKNKGTSENNKLYLIKEGDTYVVKALSTADTHLDIGKKYVVTHVRPNGDVTYKEDVSNQSGLNEENCDATSETIVCH